MKSPPPSPPSPSPYQAVRIVYPRRSPDRDPLAQHRPSFCRITADLLRSLTHLSQPDAARCLGISLSALKSSCKAVGLGRWPYIRRRACSKHATAIASRRRNSQTLVPASSSAAGDTSCGCTSETPEDRGPQPPVPPHAWPMSLAEEDDTREECEIDAEWLRLYMEAGPEEEDVIWSPALRCQSIISPP
mmetsp:Transcript_25584/g.57550  ORF Transcript_25584/g.57550 Transcript_25584/m.57550 type:complete len:189 (-) Transcript_25584:249-815(-)